MSGRCEGAGEGIFAALGVALLSTLAASCTSAPPQGGAARPGAEAKVRPADAAYDWHGLVTAPFGSILKDMPVALHEVLLFHDETHAAAEAEEQDCYTLSGPAPSFAGQKLDQYLLCFKHDRLWRIEAAVRLPAADAAEAFSQACAAWLRKAAPADPAQPGTDGGCNGREGGIGFSAQLGPALNPASSAQTSGSEVPLTIALYSAVDCDAECGVQ
jgi:hypothetical protein